VIISDLSGFVRSRRKSLNLTQTDLAEKAGTGLRFIRDLEQGKKTLLMDKVNQYPDLFGYELASVRREKGNADEKR
jgi:y4mF family transcriptional regulator